MWHRPSRCPVLLAYIPDNITMHILIPFAFCSSDGATTALQSLKLPNLEKLLARLTALPLDVGDELSLSPPHERALAHALGLTVHDGQIPWAALQAQSTHGSWGFITPCHWQVGHKHIAMSSTDLPDFPQAESQALLAAMQPFFEEDGISLKFDQADRWLAHGKPLAGLATASLDRVAGRNVASWMPRGTSAAHLQRLQSEMQMMLYTHPVNDARTERGVPPVNSFWLSGTGNLPHLPAAHAGQVKPESINTLRAPALTEDWPAWSQAWQEIDNKRLAGLLRALDQGGSVMLTLCGERNAQTFASTPQNLFKKIMNIFNTRNASTTLQSL